MEQVNRRDEIPLYIQVKQKIVEQIESGIYKSGEKIPSERELCETFNVSRITIRQALEEAVKEGYLFRKHNRGTFVSERKKTFGQPLEKIYSFQDLLISQGKTGKTKMLSSEIILSDLRISSILQLDMGTPLMNMKFVGYSEDEPVVYYNSYFQKEIGEKLKAIAEVLIKKDSAFSSIDLYKQYAGEKPNAIKQSIESAMINEDLSDIFRLEKGHLLKVTSIFLTKDQQPIEFRDAYYRGEKYIFYLNRELTW